MRIVLNDSRELSKSFGHKNYAMIEMWMKWSLIIFSQCEINLYKVSYLSHSVYMYYWGVWNQAC